jgi:hypothetical protein
VIERIKETGSKIWKFFLKVIAIFLIYFLGAITAPESWDLRTFIEKIAHDPKWTIPTFVLLAGMVLFLTIMFIVKTFFKKE